MKQSTLRKREPASSHLRAEVQVQSRLAAVAAEVSPPIGDVDDIVLDILQRFSAKVQMHVDAFAELEADIRREWGGLRPYVPKERGHAETTRRNARIREEYRRGEHLELLARRHGLAFRTIQRIVAK